MKLIFEKEKLLRGNDRSVKNRFYKYAREFCWNVLKKEEKKRSVSVLKNDSNYRKELFTGARSVIRNIHGYGTVKTKSLKALFIVLNSLIILNNVIPRCTMLKINNTRRTLKTIHGSLYFIIHPKHYYKPDIFH